MMLEINSLYFIVLIWYLSPALAPKAMMVIGKSTIISTLYNEAGR